MLSHSRSLVFLAAFIPLCASDAVGPFQYARLLAAQPTVDPLQLCADPTKVETAVARTGWSYDSGLIDISMWAGRNLTGSRSRGANQLYLDPGPHMQDFWLGAKTWDTFTGTLQPAGWTYVRRQQQDWTMRFGYVATGSGSVVKAHGAATVVGEPQLYPQLVVELPMRFLASSTGGIPRWQVTWYRGVPNQTGVWRVPAGLSLSQAQGNLNNRLADIGPFLSTFSPANGTWSMRLTTTGGGAWQLEVDKNGDHIADATFASVANQLLDTRVPGVEGQSGLLTHFGPITAAQTQVS